MIPKSVKEGSLRRYLLGTLPEEESAELEHLYFASDEVFADLLAEEDDLVDAYVAEELPREERSRFERLLPGSPRLRERVETAKALQRWKVPSRRASPTGALLIAASVLLALGVFWAARKPRPRSEVATNVTPVPAAVTPTFVPAGSIPTSGGPGRVFSVVLAAGLTRDASEATTVAVPKEAETVELLLPLESDAFSKYDIQLRTDGGRDVLERRGLHPRKERKGPLLAVEVPARDLSSGMYILTLSGRGDRGPSQTLSQCIFRVSAR